MGLFCPLLAHVSAGRWRTQEWQDPDRGVLAVSNIRVGAWIPMLVALVRQWAEAAPQGRLRRTRAGPSRTRQRRRRDAPTTEVSRRKAPEGTQVPSFCPRSAGVAAPGLRVRGRFSYCGRVATLGHGNGFDRPLSGPRLSVRPCASLHRQTERGLDSHGRRGRCCVSRSTQTLDRR
jgi:hypothetical protein